MNFFCPLQRVYNFLPALTTDSLRRLTIPLHTPKSSGSVASSTPLSPAVPTIFSHYTSFPPSPARLASPNTPKHRSSSPPSLYRHLQSHRPFRHITILLQVLLHLVSLFLYLVLLVIFQLLYVSTSLRRRLQSHPSWRRVMSLLHMALHLLSLVIFRRLLCLTSFPALTPPVTLFLRTLDFCCMFLLRLYCNLSPSYSSCTP